MPVRIRKTAYARSDQRGTDRSPEPRAEKRRQPLSMRRIRIHRSHQHQPPQACGPSCSPLMHSAAAAIATAPPREVPSRSNEETPRFSTNCRTRSAVPRIEWSIPARTIRESRAQQVRRVHGRIRRQSRHRESPGKRISQQPMQQNQRRPRPRAQIPHARAIEIHPALFHARARSRKHGAVESS